MTLECEKCHYVHMEADTATAFCPNCGAPYAVLQSQTIDSGIHAPSLNGFTGAQRPDILENAPMGDASEEMYHFSPQVARNSDTMFSNHQNRLKQNAAKLPERKEQRSLFTKMNLLIATGILVLSVALGSGIYLLQRSLGTSNNSSPQAATTALPDPTLLSYTGSGITTKYPAAWQIKSADIVVGGSAYSATYFQDPKYSKINYIILSGSSALGITAVPVALHYFGCENYIETSAAFSALINGKLWRRITGACTFATNTSGVTDTVFITSGNKSYLAIFLAPKLLVTKTFRNYETLIMHTLSISLI